MATPAPGVPSPSSPPAAGGLSATGSVMPTKRSLSEIKSKLLRPALTSHFYCQFNPPNDVREYLKKYKGYVYDADFISLSCCEASLPGSSLQTNEINDDYTGVTERLAYRRQYDDRADFTFYVDYGQKSLDYSIIWFFEQWIAYIANEANAEISKENEKEIINDTFNYRFRFPNGTGKPQEGYRSPTLYVNKFERDFQGDYLTYRLLNAYPLSINSMPVSYESSELLKCTVSFTYTRYVISKDVILTVDSDQGNWQDLPIPGLPNSFPSAPTPGQVGLAGGASV